MALYEDNLIELKIHYPDLYEAVNNIEDGMADDAPNAHNSIMIGDAVNGKPFVAAVRDQNVYALNSIYDPDHAAIRFAEQFRGLGQSTTLLMVGIGDGRIVRLILSGEYPIHTCVVYEPSITILDKVLHTFDVRDILRSEQLNIFVQNVNADRMETYLHGIIHYQNWKTFSIIALPLYDRLYTNELQECYNIYQRILSEARARMNTFLFFSEIGFHNEIDSFKRMIDGYSIEQFKNRIPDDYPCILVAAGPSLQKNIEFLKEAKGKACIICVDSAVPYLMQHDIVPDIVSTIDGIKEGKYFADQRLKGIPLWMGIASNHNLLDSLDDFIPTYILIASSYHQKLIEKQGVEVPNFEDGGSVATVSFRAALEIGFKKIIIAGQDLAYEGEQTHVDMSVVQVHRPAGMDYVYYDVEGYYGGIVKAREDFKIFLDWYRRIIAQLPSDYVIINSTEGGAKIPGTIQMTLKDAIHTYCNTSFDYKSIYQTVPSIWSTYEEKKEFYLNLQDGRRQLGKLQRDTKELKEYSDRALTLMDRAKYDEGEFQKLEKKINLILSRMNSMELYELVLERVIDQNIQMSDAMEFTEDNSDRERKKLYLLIRDHASELYKASEEGILLWENVMQEINKKYQFV